MKYTTATLIKAAIAAVVALVGTASAAANGPDLSHVDFDQWLTAIGTALVAGAALLHKPGSKNEAAATPNSTAAATVTDVVTKAAEAHGQLVQQALDGIQKVQDATGELTKLLPVPQVGQTVANDVQLAAAALGLGPLASQVINRVKF